MVVSVLQMVSACLTPAPTTPATPPVQATTHKDSSPTHASAHKALSAGPRIALIMSVLLVALLE